MASPQWEQIKSYVYALSANDARIALAALGETASGSRPINAQLSKAAFEFSKRNAGNYGHFGASYEATLSKMKAAVNDASGNGASASDTSDATTETAEQAAQITGDAAAMLERLASAYETRMKAAGAVSLAEVRELCKQAVAEMPAMRIEVTRDGALIGAVEGRQHKQFATLLKAATARLPSGYHPNIWLAGPAGSGKTHAAEQVTKALGREFFYNGALSMSHEVLGFEDAAGQFHPTPFYHGYTRPSGYLFDECDGCADNSPLLAVNGALSNGIAAFANGMARRHVDSLIMAAANTWGLGATADYVGRAKIDGAFLDRFAVKLFWDYDTELEIAICGNPSWAREVHKARKRAKENGLKVLITPRATIAGAALIAAGFTVEEAKDMTYRAGLTAEQVRQVG